MLSLLLSERRTNSRGERLNNSSAFMSSGRSHTNSKSGISKNSVIVLFTIDFSLPEDHLDPPDLIILSRRLTDGCFWRGSKLYLRQDRDCRFLKAKCYCCDVERTQNLPGEWFGYSWHCVRCTISEELHKYLGTGAGRSRLLEFLWSPRCSHGAMIVVPMNNNHGSVGTTLNDFRPSTHHVVGCTYLS